MAVAAAAGQGFSWWQAGLSLPLTAGGGVVVGLAVGWLIAWVRRRVEDTPVEITLSLVTAYAAYLAAEELGVSGILAVVSAGLFLGWRGHTLASAVTRLDVLSVWRTVVFLGNAVLFILLGLQLPLILEGLQGADLARSVGVALVIAGLVIGVRLAWVFTVPYVVRALDRRPEQRTRRVGWRERLVSGWSGMRGAVSLAAALSLPQQAAAGVPFPEEVLARRSAAEAAIARIDELAADDWGRPDTLERLRGQYEFRAAASPSAPATSPTTASATGRLPTSAWSVRCWTPNAAPWSTCAPVA